jgi:DMATS type aromatic prenyltransferase
MPCVIGDPMTRGDLDARPLVEYGANRLRALCKAAGYTDAQTNQAVTAFVVLVEPWGSTPIGHRNGWVSDVSDDNTPIEFSVVISNGCPEVRVLFEVQAIEPTLPAYRIAALAFMRRLEEEFGADLQRFRQVQDLFLPEAMHGPFALWQAVVFPRGAAPEFKVYFNPQARGQGRTQAVIAEALRRLGFPHVWPSLIRTTLRRGAYLDELRYFALDLSATPSARVKIYVNHHSATPDELELACSEAHSHVSGESRAFAMSMSGGAEILNARAAFTCSSFIEGSERHPFATTLYVAVCAYARDDHAVRERVTNYLLDQGDDARAYGSVLDGFADRDLAHGVGLQSWTAFRRQGSSTRVTLYLASEARRIFAPGSVPAPTGDRASFGSAKAVLERFASFDLDDHPFIRRASKRSTDRALAWLLVTNAYEGTSKHFIRWLANVTARVEDDQVRCLLARQLDQELGEGDFSRAHSVLMRSFLAGLEGLRPTDFTDAMLDPGRRLAARLEQHYMSLDPHEGLAALMAGEIAAHQLISAVGRLLRRLDSELEPTALRWLESHDELEGDHASESFTLAAMVPDQASQAVYTGVSGLHSALWRLLDELYDLCFGDRPDVDFEPLELANP